MIGTSQHLDNNKQSTNHQVHNHHQQQLQQPSQQKPQQHHQPHQQHQLLVNHRTNNPKKHSADDDYQDDHGMRVGNNYQAEIPQFIAYAPAPEYYEDEKAIRVWSPYNKIPDHVLEEFLARAKDKYFYNTEQALGMLSWHKFDLNRAIADLPNFVPYPNEWSVEDKVLFEQAYQFHEKQFSKIKQMLPDKTMANLINYYYGWKKTRTRASLMERQSRRFMTKKQRDDLGVSSDEDDDNADEQNVDENDKVESGDVEDSPADPSRKYDEEEVEDQDIRCCNCNKNLIEKGRVKQLAIDGLVDNFCAKCYLEYKFYGKKIVTEREFGDCFYHPFGGTRKILFTCQDVQTLAEGPPEAGDTMLKNLENQISDLKSDIQSKKQTLSQINEKIQPIALQIADLNIDEFSGILPRYKPFDKWTQLEMQLVIQGLRRYGQDFSAISDVVRTKSPEQTRAFYVSQKDRLNLQLLVNEFERNKDASTIAQEQPQDSLQTVILQQATNTEENLDRGSEL